MKTHFYKINGTFAQHNSLPVYFVANILKETDRAVYLYGQGSLEARTKHGNCFMCGRELTHPGSMKLGIGPICLGSNLREETLARMSDAEIEEIIGKIISEKKIDQWLPKSVIYSKEETSETVPTPNEHAMLKPNAVNKRQALKVQYQRTGQDAIKILFPFDRAVLENVKTIPGRKFHASEFPKYWTAPVSIEAIEILQKMDFDIDPELLIFSQTSKIDISEMTGDIDVPGLKGELFPFQAKGVEFLIKRNGRALLADEMGLGKTVQAVAWLQKFPAKRPVIIAVPASLKINWKREAEKWMTEPKIQILNGTKPYSIIGEIVIINYDIIAKWEEELSDIKPQVLIMDEAHYIKNDKAKRTKAVKKLAKGIPHVIGLTGTPIVNRPLEALNVIQMIDRSVAPDRWHYLKRYCNAKHTGFGWDFSGASNTGELHQKLVTSIMIRRKKADVLKDLPAKIRSFVPMELDNEKEYAKAEADFVSFIREKTKVDLKKQLQEQLGDMFDMVNLNDTAIDAVAENKAMKAMNVLAQIEALKQLAVQGKMNQAIEWIRDYIDGNGKLVVMAIHRFVIDRLMQEFGNIAVKVDGSVTGIARDQAVQNFQNNEKTRLFIGNIKAAGVGLTLTAASTVAFLELPWTPGDLVQAEDRVHRIGQKDSVSIYYLLAHRTIEEQIAELIDDKRQILDSVLDGAKTDNNSLLTGLIAHYKEQ